MINKSTTYGTGITGRGQNKKGIYLNFLRKLGTIRSIGIRMLLSGIDRAAMR